MKSPDTFQSGLISVIIPSYNHAGYICSALDSVLQQDYPSIELIICDDCSQDNSFTKARAWVEAAAQTGRFERILLDVNANNIGAHATLNKCMDMARGEFIAILNSDDRYTKNRLSALLATARYLNAKFLFTGVHLIDDCDRRIADTDGITNFEAMVDIAGVYPSISHAILNKNIALTTGNFFFAHELLRETGNFRPLRYCHDWDFILRACLVVEPVLLPLPLYQYRIHGANTYTRLQREKYLEPFHVCQYFFRQWFAGNCKNDTAPSLYHWPAWSGFIEMTEMNETSWCLYDNCSQTKINSLLTLFNK